MGWYQRRVHGESISELHISNMKVLISLTVVVCSALARPDSPPAGYAPAAPAYPDEPPKYAYSYSVQDDYTSNNYGANEDRDGYATSGSYYVALPDGRLQKVTYTVNGDGGYVADVTYEGEARPYNPPKTSYNPSY